MILLVVCSVGAISWPHISKALNKKNPTDELIVEETVAWLGDQSTFGNQLAATALERTNESITYDPAYYKISYPAGDVPEGKGVCTDVVIRCYRAVSYTHLTLPTTPYV